MTKTLAHAGAAAGGFGVCGELAVYIIAVVEPLCAGKTGFAAIASINLPFVMRSVCAGAYCLRHYIRGNDFRVQFSQKGGAVQSAHAKGGTR